MKPPSMQAWTRRIEETRTYRQSATTPRDFARLMRVRLSQSKIGRWTTPHPITADIRLAGLGRVRLRSHTTDISVLGELLVGDEIAGLPEMPDARTVIDLGANIGLSYRWLRVRYPHARFVCVEPDPGNLEILRFNANGCDIVAACVGARERNVALVGGGGEWGYRMADASDGAIPVITMNWLLAEHDIDEIDVLKCDIEGAEAELFADCADWIGRVRTMIVECHLDAMSSEDLAEALHANGARLKLTHLERNPEFGMELATFER